MKKTIAISTAAVVLSFSFLCWNNFRNDEELEERGVAGEYDAYYEPLRTAPPARTES